MPEIRDTTPADYAAIDALYPAAFPDEDLLPLVRRLLQEPVNAVSLVGIVEAQVVGHVIFTSCGLDGSPAEVALLGPLAVAPARQRQGIGSALVRAGLERLRRANVEAVYVLGDPRYYSRLGFLPDSSVRPPYRLPVEWAGAWQSLCLTDGTPALTGKLLVPAPWQEARLWAP